MNICYIHSFKAQSYKHLDSHGQYLNSNAVPKRYQLATWYVYYDYPLRNTTSAINLLALYFYNIYT